MPRLQGEGPLPIMADALRRPELLRGSGDESGPGRPGCAAAAGGVGARPGAGGG